MMSVLLLSAIIFFLNFFDSRKQIDLTFKLFLNEFIDKAQWFGVMFASAYAALYTRFSSQWLYLSNLYNQIKQAELSTKKEQQPTKAEMEIVLAEWKAGFIEDAQVLHLSSKAFFATIIQNWLEDTVVSEKFKLLTTGGEKRLIDLEKIVKNVCAREKAKYS
ncbi:MAG: hypothetical protein J0L53_08395 [Spirochaetes bacterium]|nr:hypothetical protein [Spirochaetota bacterium]